MNFRIANPNHRRETLHSAVLVALVTLLINACSGRPTRNEPSGTPITGVLLQTGVNSSGPIPTCLGSDFVQGVSLVVDPATSGSQSLILEHKFLDPATGRWNAFRYEYSTSFQILCIAPQSRDVVCVLGVEDGELVVERWMASYRSSGDHSQAPRMRRVRSYRGAAGPQDPVAVGADPEGRFLLILHGTPRTLSRFDFGPQQFSDLSSQLSLPSLQDYDGLERLQHETEGRIWVMQDLSHQKRLLLRDSNNDGNFDSVSELTNAAWTANGYDGAVWTNDFVSTYWW